MACWAALELSTKVVVAEGEYDPLVVSGTVKSELVELHDSQRERDIPLKVYLPTKTDPAPVVLFSHGLGGSRENSKYLGEHFAARGYVTVFMQHVGSDEALWKQGPLLGRAKAMRDAASAENLFLRCQDVKAVLDAIERWNNDNSHLFFQRLDLKHIGMCGHSFGAQTTQAVGGQAYPVVGQRYFDNRISAAVAYSPGSPIDKNSQNALGRVSIPWMLMTGTEDKSPIGGQTVETRLAVYPGLPTTIDRYEVVLFQAEHSAFSDRALPGDARQRNPNHHRVILAFTTAFWDAYLKNSPVAKQWLTGEEAQKILENKDRWQFQLKHGSEISKALPSK